jgi:hypothetical protein
LFCFCLTECGEWIELGCWLGSHRLGDVRGDLGANHRHRSQSCGRRRVSEGDLDLFEDGAGNDRVHDHLLTSLDEGGSGSDRGAGRLAEHAAERIFCI